jgi:hypothetical protein
MRLFLSHPVVDYKRKPYQSQNASDHEITNQRRVGDVSVVHCQLESQAIVDYAQYDGTAADPTMHVGKNALATRPLEVHVLQRAQDGLEDDDCAADDEANDRVRIAGLGGKREVVEVEGHADAKRHASQHHQDAEYLDGRMDGHDFAPQVRVGQKRDPVDWQVDRDGSQRKKDDEGDGHDASVSISYPLQDLERVLHLSPFNAISRFEELVGTLSSDITKS